MTEEEPADLLRASVVEITHTGGPAVGSEVMIEADEVAAFLGSGEAGGAAVRGGAIRVVGYILNAALGALAAAFMFRYLGRERVGVYVAAMAIAAIVAGLSDLGLSSLGLRELAVRDAASRAKLMRSLLGLRITVTAIGIAGAILFSLVVGYEPVIVAGVALAGASLLFQGAQGTLALSWMSRLRLGLITGTEVGGQVLNVTLTIAGVLIGAGVLYFIGIAIPVAVSLLVVTAWLLRRQVPLLPRVDRVEWTALVRSVLPFSVVSAIGVIYFRASVVVVTLTTSTDQISYFGISFRILEALIVIPGLMITGVFPIFARAAVENQQRFAYALSRVFTVALIAGVWFGLALAIGAPVAIAAFGGHEFNGAVPVLQIQAIGLAGTFVNMVWGTALLTLRSNRPLIVMSIGGLVLGTLLVFVLASSDGAAGAAAGTAITEWLAAFVGALVLRRCAPDLFPSMRVVPRVALAAGIAALPMLISGVPAYVTAIISSVIYVAILLLMRAIPAEVFEELRSLRDRVWPRSRTA